jgi:hypothetical protein
VIGNAEGKYLFDAHGDMLLETFLQTVKFADIFLMKAVSSQ